MGHIQWHLKISLILTSNLSYQIQKWKLPRRLLITKLNILAKHAISKTKYISKTPNSVREEHLQLLTISFNIIALLINLLLLFSYYIESSSFATPWTVAHQAPLLMRFFQARILEWVAISFYRGSSQPRDRT